MSEMIANIDLDGVVYPFHNACRSLAEYWLTYVQYPVKGRQVPARVRLPEPTHWNLWDEWGMTKDDWDKFWPWAVEHRVFDQAVPPIPGAREGLDWLRDRGYHIRFVTHKPTQGNGFKHHAIRDAVQWLSWNNIEYDSIVFDGNKTRYRADLIIDDNPNLRSWAQAGAANLLFDQPWNDSAFLSGDWWDVHRMFNWGQITQVHDALV